MRIIDGNISTREKHKIKKMLIIAVIGLGVWLTISPIRLFVEETFKESLYVPIGIVIIIAGCYFFKVK